MSNNFLSFIAFIVFCFDGLTIEQGFNSNLLVSKRELIGGIIIAIASANLFKSFPSQFTIFANYG
jgi:hypothetical protein